MTSINHRPDHRLLATLRFAPLPLLTAAILAASPGVARAQNPAGAPAAAPAAPPAAVPSAPPPAGPTAPPAAVPPTLAAPPAAPPSNEAVAVPPAPPEAAPDPSAGAVERLSGAAFPEWTQRGIEYGSLRTTTMHGMQWPYFPRNGVGLSGYAWLDTGYERIDRATMSSNEAHTVKYLLQQGRAAFRLTPTYSLDKWFLQAQAELIANKDQTLTQPNIVDIDDLWVRTGHWKSWDVTVGRFEGFEVYHLGMGLDINTLERNGATDDIRAPPGIHGFQYGYLRPPNVGNAAFHLYPNSKLRVEVLAQLGNEGGLNTLGGRPAVIYDLNWIKFKAAVEGRKQSAIADTSLEERTTYGATGGLQFVFFPTLECGLNVDYGKVKHYGSVAMPGESKGAYDRLGSVKTLSFGGFANVRILEGLLAGVGGNFVTQKDELENMDTGEKGKFWHLQAFAALQYVINKQLYIKFVAGYARAHLAPSNGAEAWDNSMGSGRIRLQYLF
jgi:hypothetical protein